MSLPKVIFFGTPQFAATTLQALLECPKWQVIAVVTQPDKPRGRGQQLTPSEVKALASQHGLPIFQPNRLKIADQDSELSRFREFLAEQGQVDAFIVVAYGKIVPSWLFQLAHCGAINVHGSLLPRWRGAAPLQRAILAGDAITGVCIMQIEEGLDSGPVFARREVEIDENETTGSLHDKLAKLGAELLVETLPSILSQELRAIPQSRDGISHAAKWEKTDALLRWSESVDVIARRVRACAPNPGLKAVFENQEVKILRARVETLPATASASTVGTVTEVTRECIKVAGRDGLLCIEELQFPGKRPLAVKEILKGRQIATGTSISEQNERT